VLAHYFDLATGKEYYTTAKEVAVWVKETQVAEALERRARTTSVPVRVPAAPTAHARGGTRRLRSVRPVNYAV